MSDKSTIRVRSKAKVVDLSSDKRKGQVISVSSIILKRKDIKILSSLVLNLGPAYTSTKSSRKGN